MRRFRASFCFHVACISHTARLPAHFTALFTLSSPQSRMTDGVVFVAADARFLPLPRAQIRKDYGPMCKHICKLLKGTSPSRSSNGGTWATDHILPVLHFCCTHKEYKDRYHQRIILLMVPHPPRLPMRTCHDSSRQRPHLPPARPSQARHGLAYSRARNTQPTITLTRLQMSPPFCTHMCPSPPAHRVSAILASMSQRIRWRAQSRSFSRWPGKSSTTAATSRA